jgi:hypothetical protein
MVAYGFSRTAGAVANEAQMLTARVIDSIDGVEGLLEEHC